MIIKLIEIAQGKHFEIEKNKSQKFIGYLKEKSSYCVYTLTNDQKYAIILVTSP